MPLSAEEIRAIKQRLKQFDVDEDDDSDDDHAEDNQAEKVEEVEEEEEEEEEEDEEAKYQKKQAQYDESMSVSFAKRLASNDKRVRDRVIKKLRQYLSRKQNLKYEDLMKIMRGLFYCM